MLPFIKLGYSVLRPIGDCDRYDFVVDINGTFYRIQSKTATLKKDGFSIKCRSSRKNTKEFIDKPYTKDEIDYFITCCMGKVYLVPVEEAGLSVKTLRFIPSRTGHKCAMAEDYEFDKIVSEWIKGSDESGQSTEENNVGEKV